MHDPDTSRRVGPPRGDRKRVLTTRVAIFAIHPLRLEAQQVSRPERTVGYTNKNALHPNTIGTLKPGRSVRHYFNVTAFIADPHRLLRTVMLCGFTGQVNRPLYRFPS